MQKFEIDKPLWDLKTFSGRFMHFLWVTDPRTCLTPKDELLKAKDLVMKMRTDKHRPSNVSIEEVYRAKQLYESAFHPDSGELQNIFGRMSFQMPGGMAITGAMLQFYRSNSAIIFWQWVNQSFNALVNYTNRNANSSLTTTQLLVSYVSATSSALVAAVGYKGYLTKKTSPFFLRYVPFVAVAVANCINIPLMRQNELIYGIDIQDENGNNVGKSRVAAAKGISQEINVDKIFRRTRAGKDVMEVLKEGAKLTDACLKNINNLLCEYLKSSFGLHPSSYHKNLMAISLVNTYPALASSNANVPQALWFHPHARGVNKHSGRIHYHMEYLVRKSGERIIHRQRKLTASEDVVLTDVSTFSDDQIKQMREELKFICPGPTTKARAKELWLATFEDRQHIRHTESLIMYLKEHPSGSAFNGELFSIEFRLLNPKCLDFNDKFQSLQAQILTEYEGFYRHITNQFLRTLSIIRLKNPSRGAKRLRDSNTVNDNPLQGIIDWYQDHDLPSSQDVPVLKFKGDIFADNCEGYIVFKNWSMCISGDYEYCFRVLVESYSVLNVSCRPSDKQFFLFAHALMGIGMLTTTGEKFMRSLK